MGMQCFLFFEFLNFILFFIQQVLVSYLFYTYQCIYVNAMFFNQQGGGGGDTKIYDKSHFIFRKLEGENVTQCLYCLSQAIIDK